MIETEQPPMQAEAPKRTVEYYGEAVRLHEEASLADTVGKIARGEEQLILHVHAQASGLSILWGQHLEYQHPVGDIFTDGKVLPGSGGSVIPRLLFEEDHEATYVVWSTVDKQGEERHHLQTTLSHKQLSSEIKGLSLNGTTVKLKRVEESKHAKTKSR